MAIKLSKHKNMVFPGQRDSSFMPSSGGSASSGLSLFQPAIGGGIDTGVIISHHADDKLPKELFADGFYGECPMCGADGRGTNAHKFPNMNKDRGALYYDDGREEPIECSRCGTIGTPEDFGFDKDVLVSLIRKQPKDKQIKKVKVKKAPDFSETGIWLVETPQGTKKMFSDIYNTRWWYEDLGRPTKRHDEGFLGFNKTEAIEKLLELYPAAKTNSADDDIVEYPAIDLADNWWVGEYLISSSNKLWERAEILLWPWINKVKLTRREQKADGSWKEISKIVDADDMLELVPIEQNKADDINPFGARTTNIFNDNTMNYRQQYVGGSEDGFEIHHGLETGYVGRMSSRAEKLKKFAYPVYPYPSNNPDQYTNVFEAPWQTYAPTFDIFNTYFADDIIEIDEDINETKEALYWVYAWDEKEHTYNFDTTIDINKTEDIARELLNEGWDHIYVWSGDKDGADTRTDPIAQYNKNQLDEDGNWQWKKRTKQAFIKNAIMYDSNSVIQELIKIPQIKSLIEQHGSGFVDEIKVITPSADIQQTQQKLQQSDKNIKLEPISGMPYGHVWISEDPHTHQKKPLDKIVRIDKISDPYNTLITILHEISHYRHPDFSEAQVEAEAQQLANTVKQYMPGVKNATKLNNKKKMAFIKKNFDSIPTVEVDVCDNYQKQIIGLQAHNSLKAECGMLFTYAYPQNLSFHMGSVKFPIDIIFADKDNKIIKIFRNCRPGSQEIYSCNNAFKVIEVVGSFCAFNDINIGDHIEEINSDMEVITKKVINQKKNSFLLKNAKERINTTFKNILIATAARLDDTIKHYPDLEEQIKELSKNDPSKSNKYIDWGAKQLERGAQLEEVKQLIHDFYKKQHKLSNKNIYSYTYQTLKQALEQPIIQQPSSTQQRAMAKEGGITIYENDNFLVKRIDTKEASCLYGAGTKWCITGEDENLYDMYKSQNNVIYAIISKNPASNDLDKIVTVIKKNVDNKIIGVYTHNAKNELLHANKVNEHLGKEASIINNAIMEDAKKAPMPNTINIINKLKKSQSEEEAHKLFNELNAMEKSIVVKMVWDKKIQEFIVDLNLPTKNVIKRYIRNIANTIYDAIHSEDEDILTQLSKHEDYAVRSFVAANKNISIGLMYNLLSGGAAERFGLTRNPNIPLDIAKKLMNDKIIEVVRLLAKNTTLPEILDMLANNKDLEVRQNVANNVSTLPSTLSRLATDGVFRN